MSMLKIALLQIAPGLTLEENLQKGLSACRQAHQMGADIALFPEMWSNGYRIYGRPVPEWTAEAIPADGPFVSAFGSLAQELGMAIGVTLLERCPSGPRNTLVLFDRFGRRVLTYAKVHTCDFDVERNLTPGDDFYVADLDTAAGTVKVGAMICFDREFPESARILMLQGAELILTPNACPMEINRLAQLRGRAYENMLAIATCTIIPRAFPTATAGPPSLTAWPTCRSWKAPGTPASFRPPRRKASTLPRWTWSSCGPTGPARYTATPTAVLTTMPC